ncbi:MAG TPA: dihydrolipoyl dehydrogenase [Candidatus Omnitrophota bacterium]|nr:dihydrolipoyl dehydrogenase [Candidatus Omnitrophota bacterium]
MKQYDFLVIGSGPAGHTAAIRASQLGLKTALIEKDRTMLGGVCLNEGCIPAKSLYHSAILAARCDKMNKEAGLPAYPIEMKKMVEKSRLSVEELKKSLDFVFKKNNIDIIYGTAKFTGKDSVLVTTANGTHALQGAKILISTGSSSKAIPNIAIDGRIIMNSTSAINLSASPKNILIVGGGAIGVELASFFNLTGSKVTILEAMDYLLPLEDIEISRRLEAIFKQGGIDIKTKCSLKNIKVENSSASVTILSDGNETSEIFEKVLIAVGRTPNTGSLDISKAGIVPDDRGFIPVDGFMRTTVPGVYAAGDVVKSPLLAHVAAKEGMISAETAAGHNTKPIDYTSIPNAVYTPVRVASVGDTEETLKKKGIEYKIGKHIFKANGRAVVENAADGFVKILADRSTGKILGAHIIGHQADEMIHELTLAKTCGLTISDLLKTIHAHPTFSEAISSAAETI